jgi:1-phosphofructokinase
VPADTPLIATVTLNPALDLTYHTERLLPGETTRASSVHRQPGGKGINVSRTVVEYGGDTVAAVLLGGHTGQLVARFLNDEGLSLAVVTTAAETLQNVIVHDRARPGRLRLSAPGAPVVPEELDRITKRVCCLPRRPDAIVLSGSLPPGATPATYRHIAEEAHRAGIVTVLDAEGDTLLDSLGPGTLLIKPNRYEAGLALGRPLEELDDVVKAADELRAVGARHVAITAGGGRVVLAGPDGVLTASPPAIEIRDPVGAGDAFLGVLLLRLLGGSRPVDALRWAVAAGTTAAAAASIGHRDQAERLLEAVTVQAWTG